MIAAFAVQAVIQSASRPIPTIESVILARPRAMLRATGVPCSRNDADLRARHRLFDRRQRGIGLAAIGTAGLRHIGPAAAAFAAERL
jgi:hypothetical protein